MERNRKTSTVPTWIGLAIVPLAGSAFDGKYMAIVPLVLSTITMSAESVTDCAEEAIEPMVGSASKLENE